MGKRYKFCDYRLQEDGMKRECRCIGLTPVKSKPWGPKGRNVIIRIVRCSNHYKDGVTVAKKFDLADLLKINGEAQIG